MAFCFKRKESVPKAIRRLGRERIEDALECLQDCRHGEAIHCARKDIKKVRAVLRLVRKEMEGKDFRRTSKLLRQAAKLLAAPRDSYVRMKTLTNLMHSFKGQLAIGSLRYIRAQLRDALTAEMSCFTKEKNAKTVQRLLRRVAKQLQRLVIRAKGWKALSQGVKSAYAGGIHAYQIARQDSLPENYHEWRKRAKELWYQITLLRRIWPEQMDPMAGELEMLGENLGQDHDLVMLGQSIKELSAGELHPRELRALIGLIAERQRELRAAALAIGARFYAEKPSAFCKRLAGYWRIWCKEKRPSRVAETP